MRRGKRSWPKASSFLGSEGWKTLGKMMLRPLIDLYTLGQCQKIPGFTQAKFKEEARDMYKEINRLIALNHHTALRSVCSEKAMSDIKREVKAGGGEGYVHVRRATCHSFIRSHTSRGASRFTLRASRFTGGMRTWLYGHSLVLCGLKTDE